MRSDLSPVIMPQLGVNDREITVTEWSIAAGAAVSPGQPIAQVETAKATLELASEAAGFIYPCVAAGTAVPIGDVIALIAPERRDGLVEAWRASQRQPREAPAGGEVGEITAKARRLLEQHALDPALLPKGRIVRERDVLALLPVAGAAETPSPAPVLDALQRKVAVFGASQGGLAVLDCLRTMEGFEAVAFLDDDAGRAGGSFGGLPVWHGSDLEKLRELGAGAVATHIAQGSLRLTLLARCRQAGILPLNVVHARAIVAPTVKMGEGNLVKAGAVLDTEVQLGDACIIDNGAMVPHHNRIGNACHLAPGATLGGDCDIGDFSIVGTGATVSARLKIGRNVIIGTGACVLRDIPDDAVVEGNPGRIIGTRK